jgi:hypothetical protein
MGYRLWKYEYQSSVMSLRCQYNKGNTIDSITQIEGCTLCLKAFWQKCEISQYDAKPDPHEKCSGWELLDIKQEFMIDKYSQYLKKQCIVKEESIDITNSEPHYSNYMLTQMRFTHKTKLKWDYKTKQQ